MQRWVKAGQRSMRHTKRRQPQRIYQKTKNFIQLGVSENLGLLVDHPLQEDSKMEARGQKRPREEDLYFSEDDETADDSSKPLQMAPPVMQTTGIRDSAPPVKYSMRHTCCCAICCQPAGETHSASIVSASP